MGGELNKVYENLICNFLKILVIFGYWVFNLESGKVVVWFGWI